NQGYVERPCYVGRRCLAVEHVEEVCARGQIDARGDLRAALADAVLRRHRQRDLREKAFRLSQVGGVRVVADLRIVMRQNAHRRTERIHRRGRGRDGAEQLVQGIGKLPGGRQPALKIGQLNRGRKLAVKQQVRDLV